MKFLQDNPNYKEATDNIQKYCNDFGNGFILALQQGKVDAPHLCEKYISQYYLDRATINIPNKGDDFSSTTAVCKWG